MDNFDLKKYLAEGRLYLSENASLDVDVNTEEDEVEVTYNGESYKSALGDELLFIHYFGDGEYHSENDAPEIFKYLKEKGGELEVDDDEATLTIKMSDLAEGKLLKEEEGTYRVYMNSDPDEPELIDYEIYFGDGTKAEMIKQAKEMAYSKDPTNQYGDPILVKVTHEDDIDDVAWTNIPVNEAGVLDRYRSGETPSREQFNRLHSNNTLSRLMDLKKKRLTPDEFKTLTDSLGIKLVDNSRPNSAFYKENEKLNSKRIFSWIKNLDDYEIERKLKELK